VSSEPSIPPGFDAIPDPTGPAEPQARVPALPTFEAAPLRSAFLRRRRLALAVSLVWLLANLAVYGIRPELRSLPLTYVGLQIALPFALGLASLAVALEPGRAGLGLGVGVAAALALAAPLLFSLAVSTAAPPWPPQAGDASWLRATVCFDITLLWAAVPLLFAAWALRRAFPVAASWRSALLGVTCGLFAAGLMNLHCTNVDSWHMTLGHALPTIIATLAGGLLVGRIARI
jgi:hypothetical protein